MTLSRSQGVFSDLRPLQEHLTNLLAQQFLAMLYRRVLAGRLAVRLQRILLMPGLKPPKLPRYTPPPHARYLHDLLICYYRNAQRH